MKPSNNLENKTPWDIYWTIKIVCKKVQADIFLEPPLEYNQEQMNLKNQGSLCYDHFNHHGCYRNMQFEISSRKKNR